MYLATASGPDARAAIACGDLGQMVTYKSGNRLVDGATFAIDNGRVKIVDGKPVTDPAWNEARWLATLRRYADTPGCLFAVVPDEVCDASGTDRLWLVYAPMVRALGYRCAYVLQNGCDGIPADADVVFVGGDDEFKMGAAAAALVREAQGRGLHVHIGRVNTLGRIRYAAMLGADSADGTKLAFGTDRNLPELLRWVVRPTQPNLWGVA